MKVIFISTYPPTKCGIAEYTKNLNESLNSKGVKTDIIKIEKRTSQNPFYFIGLANKSIRKSSKEAIIHIQFQLLMFGSLFGIIPGFYLPIFLLWLKLFGKSKIIITLHDIPSIKDAKEMGGKWLFAIYYYHLIYFFIRKLCDKIIIHSENGKGLAVKDWKIDEKKIFVIPLGLPNKIKKLNKNLCKSKIGYPNKKILLIFGYARGFKNYGIVLNALKSLNKDVVLIITGGMQTEKHKKIYEEINSKIEQLNLRERVKILGFVEDKDLPVLFNAADIGILPYAVTLGDFTSAAMAMQIAYQIPVLATNIHPFESFKKNNKCIETFDRRRISDLANKIRHLLYTSKKRNYLKKQSKIYQQNNNWNNIGEKVKRLYSEIKPDN